MRPEQTEQKLQQAARATLARIRKDCEAAPLRIKPLLRYLETHLFDSDLNVEQLKRATRVRNNLIPILFHQKVGQPPKAYIAERRLEVAARLLRDTDLPVWQIGQMVGYSGLPVFSRAFKRWAGRTPRDYRLGTLELGRRELAAAASRTELPSALRTLSGELATEEAGRLINRLRSLYGKDATDEEEPDPSRWLSGALWERLKGLPEKSRRTLLCEQFEFARSDLYLNIERTAREVGRHDRQRGVAMAQLALDSLERCAAARGNAGADLRARAWAWLGNARRIAVDYKGAETALRTALEQWEPEGVEADPVQQADVFVAYATLRAYERRYDEAWELANRALDQARGRAPEEVLIRCLLLRANTRFYMGDAEGCIPDLEELLGRLDPATYPYPLLSVYTALAGAYKDIGQLDRARSLVSRAETVVARVDDPRAAQHLSWMSALIDAEDGDVDRAVQCLIETRDRYVDLGELLAAAMVSMDAAIVEMERGHTRAAAKHASEALPMIQAVQIRPEAMATLHILQKALASDGLTSGLLRETQTSLRRSAPTPSLPT